MRASFADMNCHLVRCMHSCCFIVNSHLFANFWSEEAREGGRKDAERGNRKFGEENHSRDAHKGRVYIKLVTIYAVERTLCVRGRYFKLTSIRVDRFH